MDQKQSQLFPINDNQSEEQPHLFNTETQVMNGITFESKFSQFFISPCLKPLDIKFNNFQSPQTIVKSNFHLIDELNLQEEYNQEDQRSESPSSKISQIPQTKVSLLSLPITSDYSLFGRALGSRPETHRSANGLRVLSKNVYEIVLEQKITTYKEVAEKLVIDFKSSPSKPKCQERQEKNIKRRVYDALNVLVAAQIIHKDGKEVGSWTTTSIEKKHRQENFEQYEVLLQIKNQILEKQQKLEEKRLQIQELKRREEALQSILKRNTKKKYKTKQKIFFPIIGISYCSVKEDPINLSNRNEEFQMDVSEVNYVFGDIDILLRIDLTFQTIEEMIQDEVFEQQFHELSKRQNLQSISNH